MRISYFLILLFATKASAQITTKKSYDSLKKLAYVSYFERGQLIRQVSYYNNGKIKSESNLAKGKLFGLQIEYYTTGKKQSERFIFSNETMLYRYIDETISDDRLVDVVSSREVSYFESGKIKSEGIILQGQKIGLWRFYNQKGELELEEFYKCFLKESIEKE